MTKKQSDKERESKVRPEEEMGREREYDEDRGPDCPLCALLGALGRRKSRHPEFFGHLRQAETEVLQAFRSLIDDRLATSREENKPRKATKIKVG